MANKIRTFKVTYVKQPYWEWLPQIRLERRAVTIHDRKYRLQMEKVWTRPWLIQNEGKNIGNSGNSKHSEMILLLLLLL
jgi:hypothetical protein